MIGRRELLTFQWLWGVFQNLTQVEASPGTNACNSDIVVAASRAHVRTDAHTIPVTGMCPRKAGIEGVEEAELIRAEVHTLWVLTPHSPPAGFLPVIVARS